MSTRQSAPGARRNKVIVILAILLGLLAAGMNWAYTARTIAKELKVLKARKRIPAGTPVNEGMFEPVSISGDLAQMRRLVVAQADFKPIFDNKPVAETLQPGQLLLLRSFELSSDDVRESIRPGERAISVELPDEAQSVAYFVRPGDSVDVWGWIDGAAYRLKERACVRAVGDSYRASGDGDDGGDSRQYRTVTVVVSESDVKGLVSNLYLANNDITLSLVGPCEGNAENSPPALEAVTVMKSKRESPEPTGSARDDMATPERPRTIVR
jgi:Flp pilus assembly protein CpaB